MTAHAPELSDPTTELRTLIDALAPEERVVLRDVLLRARRRTAPLDDLRLAHSALLLNDEGRLAVDYRELTAMRAPPVTKRYPNASAIPLPTDFLKLEHTFDEVVRARASRRDFSGETITARQLGTLLHYGAGVRKRIVAYNTRGFPVRFTPSSGGLQAVELYVVVNDVEDLEQGLYHYNQDGHALELLNRGNLRRRIVRSCQSVDWLHYASTVLVLTCCLNRVRWKYGTRGYRFMHMDVGFVGHSVYLVATALGLRTCAVAAFSDRAVNELLELDGEEEFAALLFGLGTRPARPDGQGLGGPAPPPDQP